MFRLGMAIDAGRIAFDGTWPQFDADRSIRDRHHVAQCPSWHY